MTKVTVIHFLVFQQAIFLGPLLSHNVIIVIPRISAKVPKTAWESTAKASNAERSLISSKPTANEGIIIAKIKIVCKTIAARVE